MKEDKLFPLLLLGGLPIFLSAVQTEALFLEFNSTYQLKGEMASAYILRLEKELQQLVAQGGLTQEMTGKACLQQLWVGILYDEQLVRDLNFTGRREDPPMFGQLLQEIRELYCKELIEEFSLVPPRLSPIAFFPFSSGPIPPWAFFLLPIYLKNNFLLSLTWNAILSSMVVLAFLTASLQL
uniref:Paraneoplastic antigen Ma-like C-terminal domain-containing protein n=1 Tax=Crocodylus porosus TaxID=8502 RepID=A0A7M4EQS0_CROPO